MADGSNIANILRAIGAYREPDNAPASPRLGGDFLTPAWQAFENGGLPRQMPRQMRSPELRAQDPDPHVSAPALAELQRRMAAAQDTDAHSAYAPPEPVTWKEAGEKLLEFTGLPSVRRAAFHVGNSLINNENEWGDAAWEAGNAALMLAPAFEATRAMTAPAAAEARLGVMPPEAPPTPPPHYVGPNGMPIAPAQPFRNSLRYGSEDLGEAAAMQRHGPQSPDAGGAWLRPDVAQGVEQLRQQGFDTSAPLYHATGRNFEQFDIGHAAPRLTNADVIRGTFRDVASENTRRALAANVPEPEVLSRGGEEITRRYTVDSPAGPVVVDIEADSGGASVHWRYQNPNADNKSLADALRRVTVVMQRDMDAFGESSYQIVGETAAHNRVYQAMAQSGAFKPGQRYVLQDSEFGTPELRRNDGGILANSSSEPRPLAIADARTPNADANLGANGEGPVMYRGLNRPYAGAAMGEQTTRPPWPEGTFNDASGGNANLRGAPELAAAWRDDDAFRQAFEAISNDRSVSKTDVKALLDHFFPHNVWRNGATRADLLTTLRQMRNTDMLRQNRLAAMSGPLPEYQPHRGPGYQAPEYPEGRVTIDGLRRELDVSPNADANLATPDVAKDTYKNILGIQEEPARPSMRSKSDPDLAALAPLILSPALIAALQAYANPNGQQQ